MNETKIVIRIRGDFITLGQFLKKVDLIQTGGEEKPYLAMHDVFINGEKDIRRGRKIRPGDIVQTEDKTYEICS